MTFRKATEDELKKYFGGENEKIIEAAAETILHFLSGLDANLVNAIIMNVHFRYLDFFLPETDVGPLIESHCEKLKEAVARRLEELKKDAN